MLPAVVPKGNNLARAIGRFYLRWHKGTGSAPASPPGGVSPPTPVVAAPTRPSANWPRLAQPVGSLPAFVAECSVARRYLDLLGELDWAHFPERPTNRPWPGSPPAPRAPYVAAYLVKLNEGLKSMGKLRSYLVDHPALIWLLGFPLVADPQAAHGFNVERSVPLRRQLGRVLRDLDNAAAQFLLDGTVHLIRQALPDDLKAAFGDVISLDTKHVIAWVKENNPKAYVDERFDKTKQPKGDPDCRLGCKRRHNRGDASYLFPLLAQTERRLGRKPRFGALDKAYDAFYTYQYFFEAGGFAAVPLTEKGRPQNPFLQPRRPAPLCRQPAHAAQVRLHRPHHHPGRARTRQVRLPLALPDQQR